MNTPSSTPSATVSGTSHSASSSLRTFSSPLGSPVHTGSALAPALGAAVPSVPVSMHPPYVRDTVPMTPTTETTVGIGGAAETTDMVLNIGPQHPSTHGVLRLRLVLDGERIQQAEPVIGYMHRGAEKLFEARDYRQIVMLANRHDWLSAFSSELGVVLAVERMLGMEVPERAVWLRTLLAELNRVLNHLMFLGSYPLELGGITPVFYAFREREELQNVMEEMSGGRMHYMFNRVGGLKEDVAVAGPPARVRRSPRCARAWTCTTTWSSATRSSGAARATWACCPRRRCTPTE